MAERKYDGLDALRGVAAIAVISRHVPDKTLLGFLPAGSVAVDFFFVLSGFVLAHAYQQRLTQGLGFWAFMRLRFIRLWPLYALGTAAGAILLFQNATSTSAFLVSLTASLLFIPIVAPRWSADFFHPFPFNFPAWSLFFEMAVNALYALIARFLTPVVLGVVIILGGAGLIWSHHAYGNLDTGSLITEFWGGFGRVIYAFFTGVAVYRLHKLRPADPLPLWLLAAALVAMFALPFQLGAALIGGPVIVYYAASARSGRMGWLATQLGVASYGVYVLQEPVIIALGRAGLPASLASTLLVTGLLVVLALLADRYYDRPMRRFLARLGARKPAAAPVATPAGHHSRA